MAAATARTKTFALLVARVDAMEVAAVLKETTTAAAYVGAHKLITPLVIFNRPLANAQLIAGPLVKEKLNRRTGIDTLHYRQQQEIM
jgi:hypothetical protein